MRSIPYPFFLYFLDISIRRKNISLITISFCLDRKKKSNFIKKKCIQPSKHYFDYYEGKNIILINKHLYPDPSRCFLRRKKGGPYQSISNACRSVVPPRSGLRLRLVGGIVAGSNPTSSLSLNVYFSLRSVDCFVFFLQYSPCFFLEDQVFGFARRRMTGTLASSIDMDFDLVVKVWFLQFFWWRWSVGWWFWVLIAVCLCKFVNFFFFFELIVCLGDLIGRPDVYT